MQRSVAKILTTHVGSLPRPQEVVDVVFAQDDGRTVDDAEFERVLGAAVADRVAHQVGAGIDLVSDGEMSKIGYATYVRHRLSGFELDDVPRATPATKWVDRKPSGIALTVMVTVRADAEVAGLDVSE